MKVLLFYEDAGDTIYEDAVDTFMGLGGDTIYTGAGDTVMGMQDIPFKEMLKVLF